MRAHQPKFEVLPEPTWCRCGAELLGTGGRGGGLAATTAAAAAVHSDALALVNCRVLRALVPKTEL